MPRLADFQDRCRFISQLPTVQRGILVSDAVASLWLPGCPIFTGSQMTKAVSAAFCALYPGRPGTILRRSRPIGHLVGPAPHVTHLGCATLYTWLRQFLRAHFGGRLFPDVFALRWHSRSRSLLGPIRQPLLALQMLGISWVAPTTWRLGTNEFSFEVPERLLENPRMSTCRSRMNTRFTRDLFHRCRDFLRTALCAAEAQRRPKDFSGLENGWDSRIDVRANTYATLLHRSGPSLLMGGVWTKLKGSYLPSSDGDPTCPRCLSEPETLDHRLWSCSANAPFRDWLFSILSSPSVVDNLPTCTRRCGLIPRSSGFEVSDVLAIQSYLAGVNCHATEACAAVRQGRPVPDPAPYEPLRADPGLVYKAALPPLKKRKVTPAAANIDPGGRGRAPEDFCTPQRLDASGANVTSFPSPLRREALPSDTVGLTDLSFDEQSNGDLLVSVDGSCLQTDETLSSGWGFTVISPDSHSLLDAAGPVVLGPLDPLFVGASRHTNNCGELAALVFAFRWVATSTHCCRLRVLYDSEYAANLTSRRWRPSSNFSLVLAARAALDVLTARGVVVDWVHIDSHTGHVLNERADRLAKFGARYGLRASSQLMVRALQPSSWPAQSPAAGSGDEPLGATGHPLA